MAAPEPAERARTVIGAALGIVCPTAVPLRNGRIWLTSRRDSLSADVARAMDRRLQRRAADEVSDERLLAEAVALVGAEIAHSRGESPAVGATDALDRLLHVPDLDPARRAEAEAKLHNTLRQAASVSEEAAARFASLPGTARPPVASEIASASARITRDAALLDPANQPSLATERPAGRAHGRHRAQVGVRHRRKSLWQTLTREVPGTHMNARGPSTADPREQTQAALAALTRLGAADLGAFATGPPAIDPDTGLARVELSASDKSEYFRVEFRPTVRGVVAHCQSGAGTSRNPHVLYISSALSAQQYGDVWVSQLSQRNQQIAADRADRPTGVLGKLRSAFGREGRDHRTNADLAVFRRLSTEWQSAQNGRPTGERSVDDLERDLEGRAAAIRLRFGASPELPWATDSRYSPADAQSGVAAEAAAAQDNPQPNTQAHLRKQVVEQIEKLEASVKDLDTKSESRAKSSEVATDEAGKKLAEAEAERAFTDRLAPARAQKLADAEIPLREKAERHQQMSAAYATARDGAQEALDGYRRLLDALDDESTQPAQLAALAEAAGTKGDEYQKKLRDALPVEHLDMGVPTDHRLDLPIDEINAALSAIGSSQISADAPTPKLAASYRKLFSADGIRFTVDGPADTDISKLAEVRVWMEAEDVNEVTDLDHNLVEMNNASLGEGGLGTAITHTHTSSDTLGVGLQHLMAMAAPGTVIHAASGVVAPTVSRASGTTTALTSGQSRHAQIGRVDVYKGESVPYEFRGRLKFQVRKSVIGEWSEAQTVDAGRQLTWVPGPYTVKAPAETVTLEQLGWGDAQTGEFPQPTITSIEGLDGVLDTLVTKADKELGAIDQAGYAHLSQLITQDPVRLLRETARKQGFSRTIPLNGKSGYGLTLEAVPVWETFEPIGAQSAEFGREEVPVDLAGTNAGLSFSTSLTHTGGADFPVHQLSDLGSSGADLTPGVSAGRTITQTSGQNVSSTAIAPLADRDMTPTQGGEVTINVTARLHKLSDASKSVEVEDVGCRAKLRAPVNRLLRAGGRASMKDAVQRDGDTILTDPDGRPLLTGDPAPPTVQKSLPPLYGRGSDQQRGIGRADPGQLHGDDALLGQTLTSLSARGLVPPLRGTKIRWDALPEDRLLRASQLKNYDTVQKTVAKHRILAGLNQVCITGTPFRLEEHRQGHPPKIHPFLLAGEQDFDDVTYLGSTTTKSHVGLVIDSSSTQRTTGRSSSVSLSAGAGLSDGPQSGLRGLISKFGLTGRRAKGRNVGTSDGLRVNDVGIFEQTGATDHFRQKIRFTVIDQMDPTKPLADVDGSVVLSYDSSLVDAERPAIEPSAEPPHPDVLQGMPVGLDAGNPADRIADSVPAFGKNTVAYLQLHDLLSPEALRSNRRWMNGDYELPLSITPAATNPLEALHDRALVPKPYKIVLRSEFAGQQIVQTADMVTVDGAFVMHDSGYTSGTSVSGGISGELGGGAAGPGSSGGLKMTGGRNAGTSQSTTINQTVGNERLRVNIGPHQELLEKYRLTADVVQDGRIVATVPLEDAIVQKVRPERRALELYADGKTDLPPRFLEDIAERYLSGKAAIDPRVATVFVQRYLDSASPAEGHTKARLVDKVLDDLGVSVTTDQTPEARLDEGLIRAEQVANSRHTIGVPDAHKFTLGVAQIEAIKLVPTSGHESGAAQQVPDQDVDLLPQLRRQVEEVAPGVFGSDPLLAESLRVAFAPNTYDSNLPNMLGPDGYTLPVEVKVPGQSEPDVFLVHANADWAGDYFVGGKPDAREREVLERLVHDLTTAEAEDAVSAQPGVQTAAIFGINQNYGYKEVVRSGSHSTTYSGGVAGDATNGDGMSLSGSAGTDQTRQDTSAQGHLGTILDRTGAANMSPVGRKLVLTTWVERVVNARPANQSRRRLTRPPESRISSAPAQVHAEMQAFIPRELVDINPDAAEQTTGERFRVDDHRRAALPGGVSVVGMLPHGKDAAKEGNELRALIASYYEGKGGVPAATMARIERRLMPTTLAGKLPDILETTGYRMPPEPKPGNGRTSVQFVITGDIVGWDLDGRAFDGQAGFANRDQKSVKGATAGNQLAPGSMTAGSGNGVISYSHTESSRVRTEMSGQDGTRLESLGIRAGDILTDDAAVACRVYAIETTDNGRDAPPVKKTTLLGEVQTHFYVSLLRHQHLQFMKDLETGAGIDDPGDLQLLAAAPEFGKPDLRASEYGRDPAGNDIYQPYRPMLDALALARKEQRNIVLSVRGADGEDRLYQAFPNGTMAGVDDGGFATAFARLKPELVLLAQAHHVDLRRLYNTSSRDENFSHRIAVRLERADVPKSVLMNLDHETASAHAPSVPRTSQGSAVAGAAVTRSSSTPAGQTIMGL
jgi:hypothetical protein